MNAAPSPPPLVVLALHKRLVAMNAHTGQRVGEFDTGSTWEGRLVIEHGLVLYSAGRELLCVDYFSGALRWRATLPGTTGGGRLVLYAGCVVATGMGEAAALNAQTGAVIWHDTFKGYGSMSGPIAAPSVSAQIDKH